MNGPGAFRNNGSRIIEIDEPTIKVSAMRPAGEQFRRFFVSPFTKLYERKPLGTEELVENILAWKELGGRWFLVLRSRVGI